MAGAPKTLTEAQEAEVETLAAVLNARQIADYFGIGRTTFFAMIEREPRIAERYKRGKAKAVGAIAQSIIQKARGGGAACMIFYLKTQAGWRESAPVESLDADIRAAARTDPVKRLQELLGRYAENRAAAEGREAETGSARAAEDKDAPA
ncbi:MAG: hypothetical protein AAF322_04010 [Pseudomonadota bacterium]